MHIKIEKSKLGVAANEERRKKHCCEALLAELEAEAESQLVLLDLSISVDVTVTHQGFPELVQVCATDAGLEERVGVWRVNREVRGQ